MSWKANRALLFWENSAENKCLSFPPLIESRETLRSVEGETVCQMFSVSCSCSHATSPFLFFRWSSRNMKPGGLMESICREGAISSTTCSQKNLSSHAVPQPAKHPWTTCHEMASSLTLISYLHSACLYPLLLKIYVIGSRTGKYPTDISSHYFPLSFFSANVSLVCHARCTLSGVKTESH